uniref:Uncharacterized protein n=1 Tax=Pipistrellus kuhlii TaxID=59472 RepID=A0A7J7SFM0_PIPKU|nr:hypothetical protein mPipKuh1_009984 [Pipistrellus kuhlii]
MSPHSPPVPILWLPRNSLLLGIAHPTLRGLEMALKSPVASRQSLRSFIKTRYIISPMYHPNSPCAVTRGRRHRTQQNPFYWPGPQQGGAGGTPRRKTNGQRTKRLGRGLLVPWTVSASWPTGPRVIPGRL